jgi:glutamate-1-semialdehyde 2,1-aminomutase
MSHGLGSRVWDVDGNEYIDLMCSYGPVLLGHRHPRVDEAVARQAALADCQNGPSPRMVELAEAMTDSVDHADWAIFSKNGTDATTQCVTIARAATAKRKILVATGAYHGAAPWCTPGPSGVLPEDRAHLIQYRYNDLASVEAAASAAGDDLAGIVVSPIRHDIGVDLELPDPVFATGLRALCDRTGAVLILDDVRCGLRLHHGSSWEPIGVAPDLSAWSKAIANGYALGAVLGRASLADAVRSIYTTGSFWFAAVSMAASLATLQVLDEEDTVGRTVKIGTMLREGLAEQASARGLEVSLSGPVQMPFLSFAGDDTFALANVFAQRSILGGVYLHPRHNWFVSGAMDEDDLARVLDVTESAFDEVAASS